MAKLHDEAITTYRQRYPDDADVPDQVLAGMAVVAWISLALALRDVGRALAAALPGWARRALER